MHMHTYKHTCIYIHTHTLIQANIYPYVSLYLRVVITGTRVIVLPHIDWRSTGLALAGKEDWLSGKVSTGQK